MNSPHVTCHSSLFRRPVAAFLSLLLCVAGIGLAAGCASVPAGAPHVSVIERVLDAALPAAFSGDTKVVHKNPWIDVTIAAGNVRQVDGRWTWDWLEYTRNGRFSAGTITLGARK